jgi:hypothetical protein
MRNLPDTKWLRQIVMPGSHDAGVYGTAQVILRADSLVKHSYTVCQHSDFAKQALAGSRFFDCRVFFKKIPRNERLAPDRKYENVLGHFAREKGLFGKSKEPTLGGYGFVLANPSEFVILRFSHTYHPAECISEIKQIIASKPTYGGAVYKQPGNIAVRTIGELRGKVIMVFDEQFNHNITPSEGIHRFKKYSGGLSHIDGLSTCGKFSSSMSMAKVHEGAIGAVDQHLAHPGDPGTAHLHFVYWQQTAGMLGEKDVFRTTSAARGQGQWTGGAHANLGAFMTELNQKKSSSGRVPANVISHDFVTAETCKNIIRLNPECSNLQ